MTTTDYFQKISSRVSSYVGTPYAFMLSVLVIIIWIITGPAFDYSDTWQLVINTGTTIVTFLMIFLVQTTQNRDAKAIHLKLDELIRSIKTADNRLVDIEEGTEQELETMHSVYKNLREENETHSK
jgi:low affinity Fe/Cu permease